MICWMLKYSRMIMLSAWCTGTLQYQVCLYINNHSPLTIFLLQVLIHIHTFEVLTCECWILQMALRDLKEKVANGGDYRSCMKCQVFKKVVMSKVWCIPSSLDRCLLFWFVNKTAHSYLYMLSDFKSNIKYFVIALMVIPYLVLHFWDWVWMLFYTWLYKCELSMLCGDLVQWTSLTVSSCKSYFIFDDSLIGNLITIVVGS